MSAEDLPEIPASNAAVRIAEMRRVAYIESLDLNSMLNFSDSLNLRKRLKSMLTAPGPRMAMQADVAEAHLRDIGERGGIKERQIADLP